MKDDHQSWLWGKLGEKCVQNLKKRRFDAHLLSDAEEARSFVLDMIGGYDTFGFGGSYTTKSLGLAAELRSRGKTVFDHSQEDLSPEQALQCRYQQLSCQCFLCSANAIAVTGEIINVDGVGNRTSAMAFGPKKVVILAGMNKVTPDLHSGIKRIRDVAAPMRAKSLGLQVPCAETGICNDCQTPTRICNITTILHARPALTDVSVVLVNQALGF